MLIKHRDSEPLIDPSVFVAPNAVVVGRVTVRANSRIIYGAVLNSEGSKIEIGEYNIICENTVLRASSFGDQEYPVVIGDHVFVSPQSTLLGCTIESCTYIATGATVLQGSTVHSGAVVAVGAFVHAKTVIPEGTFIPPNNIAIGNPLRIFSPDEKNALTDAIRSIGFAKIAFNVDAQWEDRLTRYKQATEVRSKEFENHFNDLIIK